MGTHPGVQQASPGLCAALAEAMWNMSQVRSGANRNASARTVLRELQGPCRCYLKNHFRWVLPHLAEGEFVALADDATQFTLEALCNGRLRSRPPSDAAARAWLRTCAHHFVSNQLRRRLRETHEFPDVADESSSAGTLGTSDLTHFLCAVETELAFIRRARDLASQRLAVRCWLSDTVYFIAASGPLSKRTIPAPTALERKRKQRGRAAAQAAVVALVSEGRASPRVLRVAELLKLDL